jgi:hypothetical protein
MNNSIIALGFVLSSAVFDHPPQVATGSAENVGWTITINAELTDSVGGSAGAADLTRTLMHLPTQGGAQDAEPELDGTFKNSTTGVRRLADVKMWFEKKDGTILTTPNSEGPVSSLKTKGGTGTPTNSATLVSRSGGISTFNLADTPGPNAFVQYDAQVDYFAEPLKYNLKISFSQKKASTGKHYEIVGVGQFSQSTNEHIFNGNPPTARTGVFLSMKNVDSGNEITGGYADLVSNQSGLEFNGAAVLDTQDNVITGATVSISDDGRRVSFSDLSLTNPDSANLWLDLNSTYSESTTFTLHATY